MRAFHERIRARRGHQVATVAVARKLSVLFWHLLARGEDYAYGRPTLTQKKLRQLELAAGAPSGKGLRNPSPTGPTATERRDHERATASTPNWPTSDSLPTGNEQEHAQQRLDFPFNRRPHPSLQRH